MIGEIFIALIIIFYLAHFGSLLFHNPMRHMPKPNIRTDKSDIWNAFHYTKEIFQKNIAPFWKVTPDGENVIKIMEYAAKTIFKWQWYSRLEIMHYVLNKVIPIPAKIMKERHWSFNWLSVWDRKFRPSPTVITETLEKAAEYYETHYATKGGHPYEKEPLTDQNRTKLNDAETDRHLRKFSKNQPRR